jgi:hypothetical protein
MKKFHVGMRVRLACDRPMVDPRDWQVKYVYLAGSLGTITNIGLSVREGKPLTAHIRVRMEANPEDIMVFPDSHDVLANFESLDPEFIVNNEQVKTEILDCYPQRDGAV